MILSREKFLAAAMALAATTSACSKDPKVTADGQSKGQSTDVSSPTEEGGVPAPTLEGQAVPSPVAEILPAPTQEGYPVPPVSPVIEGFQVPTLPPIPSRLPQAPPIQIPQGLPKPPPG